jgi:hypothetical protein
MNPNQNRLLTTELFIEEAKLNDPEASQSHISHEEPSNVPSDPKIGLHLLTFVGGIAVILVLLLVAIRFL